MRPFAWRLPQLPAYRSGMMPPGMAAACASWKVSPATVYRHRQEPARPKLLANAHEPPPLLHPNMAEVWRQRVAALHEALQDESSKAEAFEVLRSLIDRVTLVPEDGQLAIELRGDLAAMLAFSANRRRSARGTERPGSAIIVGCGGVQPT